jgi:hypothetical protein
MNHVVIPVQIATDRPRRRLAFAVKLGRLPRLSRVLGFVAGVIARHDEDDVVERYEGHSWCASTERSINYDIMTGRRTWL